LNHDPRIAVKAAPFWWTPMDQLFSRMWDHLISRGAGLMSLRIILQPLMATIFATRDGVRDARSGRPAFFWSLIVNPEERRTGFKELWQAVGKIFILALILDCIYQLIMYRWIYIGEALILAGVVALVPYLLIRGPVNRIARALWKPEPFSQHGNHKTRI
jgi:hypothetical protein